MSNDSTKKTIAVAVGVCLVCSIFVSTTFVTLNAKQKENKKLDKLVNILMAGNLLQEGIDVKKTFDEKIKGRIINLETGDYLPEDKYNDQLNIESFDIKTMASDSKYGMAIPANEDIAQIKRKPRYMTIFLVQDDEDIDKYILPIYGKGLWSTLYGFIALGRDLRTIKGFTFYEHGETPGLGGEVDNPRWKKLWNDKQAFDENWNVAIEVIKGLVDPTSPRANSQIDGLSGSTLTTRGVDNLVKFWLGKNGYGPFFQKLRESGIHE